MMPASAPPAIQPVYGPSQQFRFRCRDVTVLGHVEAAMPLRQSVWHLNDGPPTSFYVEHVPDTGMDWRSPTRRARPG